MEKVTLPDCAEQLTQFLASERDSAFSTRSENKAFKEWFTVNLMFRCGGLDLLFAPGASTIVENIEEEGRPDFKLTCEERVVWLEVTEATFRADRIAITKSRALSDGQRLGFGEDVEVSGKLIGGGRFKDGVIGFAYEEGMLEDIEQAIARKAKKKYAHETLLLIYPNSNAIFADANVLAQMLDDRRIKPPFHRVFILHQGIIELANDQVTYHRREC